MTQQFTVTLHGRNSRGLTERGKRATVTLTFDGCRPNADADGDERTMIATAMEFLFNGTFYVVQGVEEVERKKR